MLLFPDFSHILPWVYFDWWVFPFIFAGFVHWPCYVGPFHHSIAYPQIADGGDGLHMWRVTANILNMQL